MPVPKPAGSRPSPAGVATGCRARRGDLAGARGLRLLPRYMVLRRARHSASICGRSSAGRSRLARRLVPALSAQLLLNRVPVSPRGTGAHYRAERPADGGAVHPQPAPDLSVGDILLPPPPRRRQLRPAQLRRPAAVADQPRRSA